MIPSVECAFRFPERTNENVGKDHPLPWLVYSEGFGVVVPVEWTFNLLFFIIDAVLYASTTYVLFLILAKSKLLK